MPNSKAIKYFNENAEALSKQYNSLDRSKVHADLLMHLPTSKKLRMLDVGAGSGADAYFFAAMGHDVVAAEPAKKLKSIANKTFKNKRVKWNADVLPQLKSTTALRRKFDVVYAVGTLQYLDAENRIKSLKKMVSLLKTDGLLEIQYPTPTSREYQHTIGPSEITDFVRTFNEKSKTGLQIAILEQKNIKDHTSRKALDGSDLYFSTTILKLFKILVK